MRYGLFAALAFAVAVTAGPAMAQDEMIPTTYEAYLATVPAPAQLPEGWKTPPAPLLADGHLEKTQEGVRWVAETGLCPGTRLSCLMKAGIMAMGK